MNLVRRLLAALSLTACAATCPAVAAVPPARVVSLNLCTDLLLIEVGAPAQIAGVTALARDPALSPHAADAARLPVTPAQTEALLALQPDLVLAAPGAATTTIARLRELGLRVALIEPATTLNGIIAALRETGELLARAATAEQLVAGLQLPPAPPAGRAWLLQAGGHTPGQASLGHALLAAAGLRDLASETGHANGGFVPLERVLAARADVLVLGRAPMNSNSLAQQFLNHAALRQAPARRIHIDEALWVCGSARFAEAVTALRAALAGR